MVKKTPEQKRAENAAYMRAQRSANPEKHRAKSREFTARHRERLNAERNASYAKNKASIRAKRHRTKKEIVDVLMLIQENACAVCDKKLAPWPSVATHLDHCHDTGEVRGLLCRSCNMKEGWVRKYGEKLAAYLRNPPINEAKDIVGET